MTQKEAMIEEVIASIRAIAYDEINHNAEMGPNYDLDRQLKEELMSLFEIKGE